MRSFYFKVYSTLAIICLGIVVYSNTFFSSFHFDDDFYIINDFAIRNIQILSDIWNICPCRFVTFLSLALNYHFGQLNVLGYHLFNIALHLGSAVLVWWLTLLTFSTPAMKEENTISNVFGFEKSSVLALLAGLIFVSHPIQIQAVTYIWQRAASMAAFFYLASLSFYVKSRLLDRKPQNEPTLGPGIIYYILSLITAVAAMFTKENAITLPLMICLYEFCFLKSSRPALRQFHEIFGIQLYPFWLVMFIIPATMLLTHSSRFLEIQSIAGGNGGISSTHYLLTQLRVIFTYVRLIFFPLNLNLDYDYPIFKNLFAIPVLTSFLLLSTALFFAKRLFLEYRLISFSIFWFFLTLLPESSILPQEDVIFEHRLYLPLVGYCLFLVSGVYYLLGKNNLKWIVLILSLMIIFYAVLTYQRNEIWKNEISLWSDVIRKSPHKARAYNNLGWAYYNQGGFTQAMAYFNKAIELNPRYLFSYDDRGLIDARQGKFPQAIAEYNKAISINPNYAMVYFHRGLAFLKQDKGFLALSDFNKAIELNPEYRDAFNARGDFYYQQGNLTGSMSNYTKSIKIDPDQADVNGRLKKIIMEIK